MKWYLKVLRNYVQFEGRARRKEFWMFFLFAAIFGYVAVALDLLLGLTVGGAGVLNMLYGLAILLPTLGVGVRRLHDINKSGWWILLSLIPIVGQIWILILWCTPGEEKENQYGPNPILMEE